MTDQLIADPPSPFVVHWGEATASSLPPPRRALDVAMGRGRHARALAQLGLRVFGVDADFEAVRTARARAAADGLAIAGWCADLTRSGLPPESFAMIVVAKYLQRDLFASLRGTLAAGGVVIYETFTVSQRALGAGPRSPDHLLEPGELLDRFAGFEIVFYEEVTAPQAMARLVARK